MLNKTTRMTAMRMSLRGRKKKQQPLAGLEQTALEKLAGLVVAEIAMSGLPVEELHVVMTVSPPNVRVIVPQSVADSVRKSVLLSPVDADGTP
jgi:hypothetical protein